MRILRGLTVSLLVGAGLGACSGGHATTPTPPLSKATATVAGKPTTVIQTTTLVVTSIRCEPAQLQLSVGQPVSETTGQHSLLLVLTNVGHLPCYLFGYPGITLYNSQNQILPLVYQREGDQVVTSSPPQRVNLASGSTAFVAVNKYRCDLGDKSVAEVLQLIPPGDTSSMTLNIAGLRDLAYCGPGDPGSTLEISPVEPTAAATFAS